VAALEDRHVLTPAQCGAVRAALEAFWAALPAGRRVLCHGDVGVGNAPWRDGRVVCLLDFEFAAVAPVELDAHSLLQGLDALDDDLETPDPQPDPTGAGRRRLTEALAQAVRPALTAPGAPDRLRGYAVLFQLWSMLGWLKHWKPGEDHTTWRPFRLLTALAGSGDGYLAPLSAAA
jgi:Ser/Thr protein kinase RdoA (MazF antagonist)